MDRINTTLEVLTTHLNNLLKEAAEHAAEAETSMAHGHRNQAIGTLAITERSIREIAATFDMIMSIHRSTRS